MTPKEKAKELYQKYFSMITIEGTIDKNSSIPYVKQCALIAVDEILESLGYKKLSDSPYTTLEARQYYVQVKQEIENL
jgi:hypothetical protein